MGLPTYNIAVVGATGTVGEAVLDVLHERQFPLDTLYPLASAQSIGKPVMLGSQRHTVQDVAGFDFSQVQYAFFVAGSEVASQYVPIATEQGCVVVDNSSYYRQDPQVPLVIPEVNAEVLAQPLAKNLIANPNCSTIQLLVALNPLHEAVGLKRIDVATYQAVSGAGNQAIKELAGQAAALLNGQEAVAKVIPQQIAFNVVPHIDQWQDNGFSGEEMKMYHEAKKIWQDESVAVNATAVRVPVFYGHSEAVHLETNHPITVDEAAALLRDAPGVVYLESQEYPTPITHAASHDGVYVGRLRQNLGCEQGLNLWVVADNIKKGAALNAVQIVELLIKRSKYLN